MSALRKSMEQKQEASRAGTARIKKVSKRIDNNLSD